MNKPLRIDNFEKAVMSAANGKKMLARQDQIASDLAYYVERGFAGSKKEMTSKCNKALYDLAEKRGISLWELCFSVVPRWNQVESDVDTSDPLNITFNADYRLDLVPLEIDFEHGPDYWEDKYFKLKEQMQKLVDDKDDGDGTVTLARGHHVRNADGSMTDVSNDPRYKCKQP